MNKEIGDKIKRELRECFNRGYSLEKAVEYVSKKFKFDKDDIYPIAEIEEELFDNSNSFGGVF